MWSDSLFILPSSEHLFPAPPALNQCPGQGHKFQAGNESLVMLRAEESFVGILFVGIIFVGQQQGELSVVSLQFRASEIAAPTYFGFMERNQVSGMLCSMTSSPIHPTLLGNSHHFLFVL